MPRILRSTGVAALLLVVALCVPASSAGPRSDGVSRSSSTPIATFVSGGGISFMRVEVDARGHLSLESPRGVSLTWPEGYAICTGGSEATAIDLESSEGHSVRGFSAPVISQPKPGSFPVTITRRTLDRRFKLSMLWAVPDASEKDVTVTMTLKNIGTATASGIELIRSMEAHSNYGDVPPLTIGATGDSVVQWWGGPIAHGLTMTARTLGVPHEGGFPTDIDLPDICGSYYDPGPDTLGAGGYARIDYFLPALDPGHAISVVVLYRRI